MAKVSRKLMNMLTEFLVCEIESRALHGVTYTMVLKNNREDYDHYMEIKKEALECGFGQNDIFRVYEVSNGYIFDMDLTMAKYITAELSKVTAANNGGQTPVGDLIGHYPDKRRRSDMEALYKYALSEYRDGKRSIEVALFSRNRVPRIVINGQDKNNKPTLIKYNAYAIRHWDIGDISNELMAVEGIRISKIEPVEVLPSRTGVKFILHLTEDLG